jgi:hypothetical protein
VDVENARLLASLHARLLAVLPINIVKIRTNNNGNVLMPPNKAAFLLEE